jgi:hypothetical protein
VYKASEVAEWVSDHASGGAGASCVGCAGDCVDVGPAGVVGGVHVCHLGLHQLELPNGSVELAPLVHIGERMIDDSSHNSAINDN